MMDSELLVVLGDVLQGIVALMGLFLSTQAYRGYTRHNVETMRYLAFGIALLTTVPTILSYGLSWGGWASDALTLFVVALSYLLGLGALDYAFNYSSE